MYCVLNHYKRDPQKTVSAIESQGRTATVFTDHTDWYLQRNSIERYTGLSNNYLNIMNHKTGDAWKIIMHDDISITPDLLSKIEYILESAPRAIISFYCPTNDGYHKAFAKGHHSLKTYSNFWSQCHAIPTDLSYEFADWCKEHVYPFGFLAEDGMVHCWSTITNTPIYAVLPSLVQHEGYSKSIFKNPAKAGKYFRYSEFYNPQFDVTTVDWKKEFDNAYPENKRRSNFAGVDGKQPK